MMKCKHLIFISLCFITLGAQAARDRKYGENCAAKLYEQGTATGARLTRRTFNSVAVGSILFSGYTWYNHLSFQTQVQVIYSLEEAKQLTRESQADRMLVATSAYNTVDSDDQHDVFMKDNGLEQIEAFHRRRFFGLIPFGMNVTRTLADIAVVLSHGEKVDFIKHLAVLNQEASHRGPELKLLKQAFSQLEAPNYFATHFPNEPRAAQVDKNIKHIRTFLFQDEIQLNLELKLKLKVNERTNQLEAEVDAPQFVNEAKKLTDAADALEKMDEISFRLFYSALSKAWSEQLTKYRIHNPIAELSSRIAPYFLPSTTKVEYDAFIRDCERADQQVFEEEMRRMIQYARKHRIHITLLALDKKPEEMEASVKKLLDE